MCERQVWILYTLNSDSESNLVKWEVCSGRFYGSSFLVLRLPCLVLSSICFMRVGRLYFRNFVIVVGGFCSTSP